jgi:hypothetical protein
LFPELKLQNNIKKPNGIIHTVITVSFSKISDRMDRINKIKICFLRIPLGMAYQNQVVVRTKNMSPPCGLGS